MGRSALRFANSLLLLVPLNPHRVLSESDINYPFMYFVKITSDNVNNNHQYFITTTTTTTTRKAKDLRTMSWAKVTRGAQRRRRRRRKTKRRPLILLSSDLHFELWTLLFWFLTAHFETGAPVYHPSRVYPTSISNFPIPTSRLIRLVSRSQPTWSRHIIHSETH